jgi:hypothetical protein
MTDGPASCPHCSAPLTGDTYYCGECGKAVKPSDRPATRHKPTMMGTSLGPLPPLGASPPAPKSVDPASDAGRTTQEGMSEPPVGQFGRTVLGLPMAAKPMPPAEPGAAPPAGPQAPADDRKFARTMLGGAGMLPAMQPPASAAQGEPAAKASAAAARTMLGDASLLAGAAAADAAAAVSAKTAKDAQYVRKPDPRTMLGLEQEGAAADAGASGLEIPYSPSTDSPAGDETLRPPRPAGVGGGVLRFALALAVVVLLGAVAYVTFVPSGPEVKVSVTAGTGGEAMLFEVPGAKAGTKLRFGGQEKTLEAGRASFGLAADSLRVGQNVVLYDVIEPGGSIRSGKVALAVDYRVTLDTAPLRAGKAAVEVVVAALPGSKAWLDGAPLALDAQGRAVRSDPLEPAPGAGEVEHVVRYRVQPPNAEATVGELRTVIAVTALQIDRPGPKLVTDRDSVEIAGAVGEGARVTLDGQPIEVREGRFLHRFALPAEGRYAPVISAMADGKAPSVVQLELERVADLAKAAEGFEPDRTLSYAKLAQNPTIYVGQRAQFEGRVYNVIVEGGRSVLQILVRECPDGERCPLWVGYPAATDFTIDSWVRVLGTVAGEQQFRAENDEVKTVPKVEASFLLPAEP